MTKITGFIELLLICLILIWVAGMTFSADKCTRVHRAAWPVTYTMDLVQALTENWVTTGTKIQMIKYKAKGAVAMESIFERTVYGDQDKCSK
jgi:hypothetical protein